MPHLPSDVVIPEHPATADREIILNHLIAFEHDKAGPLELRPLAILIKDENGATTGGLWGNTVFRWLVVELFFVPEDRRGRGLGRTMMLEAEAIARTRGCIGIWLDTYSFQAPAFYAKLGFAAFGRVDDHPPGKARIFMQKSLLD